LRFLHKNPVVLGERATAAGLLATRADVFEEVPVVVQRG
jgi:hypothetical protein